MALSSSIPGEQSPERAEAYGILYALLIQKLGSDLTIHSDSERSIKYVNKVRVSEDPRLWKTLPNYSIYLLIVRIIDKRTILGAYTRIEQVKGHTNNIDMPSNLNREADVIARTARDAPCLFREPFIYLPRLYLRKENHETLQDRGPIIRTHASHSFVYSMLDDAMLQEALAKTKDTSHLRYLVRDDMWDEASRKGWAGLCKQDIFMAKLSVGSLPTPRNIQVTNTRNYPDLYPRCHCPLHPDDEAIANEHHILSRCPAIASVRTKGLEALAEKLNALLPTDGTRLDTTLLTAWFTPRHRGDFFHGRITSSLKEWLIHHYPYKVAGQICSRLQTWVRDFYFELWCSYTDIMVKRECTLAHRVHKVYGKSVKEMGRSVT